MCSAPLLSADLFTITQILIAQRVKGDYFGNNVTSSDKLLCMHKMLEKSCSSESRRMNISMKKHPPPSIMFRG